jgi:hypothetical protein
MGITAPLREPTLPNQVRIIRAHLDEAEETERLRSRPRQRPTLPSPRPAALSIAVTVLEVRNGVRSPWHLERLSHYTMWPFWDTLADHSTPHQAGTAARPLSLTLQEHTPGLVHATVVLEFAGTVQPISLSLDGAHGRWELIELEYPTATTLPRIPPPTPDLPPQSQRANHLHRRGHTLNGAPHFPLGQPRRPPQRDPPWQPQPLDTPGIELE